MAIRVSTSIGQNVPVAGSTASTVTFNTTATVPPGGKVVCFVGWFGTATLSSGSDNGTVPLTWRVAVQVVNASNSFGIMEADAPQGLASGTTITATFSAATPDSRYIAGVYAAGVQSGAAITTRTDTTGTTSWTTGARTIPNGGIAFGGCREDGISTTNTAAGSFTEVHDFNIAGDSAMCSEWRYGIGSSNPVAGTWAAAPTNNAAAIVVWAMAEEGTATVRPILAAMKRPWRQLPRLGFPLPNIEFPLGGGVIYQPTGSLTAGVLFAGADVFESSETGALTPLTSFSGADVAEHAETGSLTPFGLVSGADSFQPSETGSLTPDTSLSGADVFTATETGALVIGALLAGADTFTATETGSLTPDTSLSGADVQELARLGSITPDTSLSGADVDTAVESGSLTPGALFSGVEVKLTSGLYTKTGAIVTGTVLAGGDAVTAARMGSLTPSVSLSGGRVVLFNRTASLTPRALLSGVSAKVSAVVPNIPGDVVIVETAPQVFVVTNVDGTALTVAELYLVAVALAETIASEASGSEGAGGPDVTVTS